MGRDQVFAKYHFQRSFNGKILYKNLKEGVIKLGLISIGEDSIIFYNKRITIFFYE